MNIGLRAEGKKEEESNPYDLSLISVISLVNEGKTCQATVVRELFMNRALIRLI